MKIKSIPTLILLSSLTFATFASGCGKQQAPVAPYPNTSGQYPQMQQPAMQQGLPMTQGANPAYGGDANFNYDDSGNWDGAATGDAATTPAEGELPADGAGLGGDDLAAGGDDLGLGGDDLGLGDDLGGDDFALGDDFDIPDLPDYAPPGGGEASYSLVGNFLVDQDNYIPPAIPTIGALMPSRNQWQASGVTVVGSDVIVTATDSSGLFKKGTVITMDAESGGNWKNIGSRWLGVSHPMDATVKGIAFDGSGKIYANDTNNYIYVLSEPKFAVEKVEAGLSDAIDIAAVSNSIIVATTGGLMKFDQGSLNAGTSFAGGVSISGGIGSDKDGNLYAISGSSIKKISSDGSAQDIITDASGAIDVTVTAKGEIAVLTSDGIKLYDEKGEHKNDFGSGDAINPKAIATDGENIFVADSGSSYKDSKVIKYSIMTL